MRKKTKGDIIKLKGGEEMAGKTTYKNKWTADNCDRVSLVVPKGMKEKVKAHAEAHGETLNGFIKRAIEETIQADIYKEQLK